MLSSHNQFPAALQSLPSYVEQYWSEPRGDFADIKARFPEKTTATPDAFVSYCKELNSTNSKFPPWKTLQGILWRQLYQDGTVKAPLYDDVLPALNSLKEAGVRIYIYSSGSIEAQKLLFAHTNEGDLRALIDGCIPALNRSNVQTLIPLFCGWKTSLMFRVMRALYLKQGYGIGRSSAMCQTNWLVQSRRG